MSQKPVDKRSPLATREAIWQVIRATKAAKPDQPNQHFTARHVRRETSATMDTVKEYLTGLHRAGIIQVADQNHPDSGRIPAGNVYQLVKDLGPDAPRVRRDGSEITQGRGQENMWRTMRILKHFTAKDLAVMASTDEVAVAESAAKDYCQNLFKAGYLQQTKPGGPNTKAQYYFPPKCYTGPKPPMVQRISQIYDPNLKKVVWKGGDHDAQ